jgi:hypothetical protein
VELYKRIKEIGGWSKVQVQVLERCPLEHRSCREQAYMDLSDPKCLNVTKACVPCDRRCCAMAAAFSPSLLLPLKASVPWQGGPPGA